MPVWRPHWLSWPRLGLFLGWEAHREGHRDTKLGACRAKFCVAGVVFCAAGVVFCVAGGGILRGRSCIRTVWYNDRGHMPTVVSRPSMWHASYSVWKTMYSVWQASYSVRFRSKPKTIPLSIFKSRPWPPQGERTVDVWVSVLF